MRWTVWGEGPCSAVSSSSVLALLCSSVVPSSLLALSSSAVGVSEVVSGVSTSSSLAERSVTSGVRTPLFAAAGVGSNWTHPCSGPNHTSGQAWALRALTVRSSPSASPAVKPMTTRVGYPCAVIISAKVEANCSQ